MSSFLIYEGKVAVALLVFYLFYRFLLKKETFHRFNRVVLVGTAVLSFLLPLCIITIRKPVETAPAELDISALPEMVPMAGERVTLSQPWWQVALILLFFAGVAFVLIRILVSVLSILRIIRHGRQVLEEDGCRVIVTERDIDPFSWMRYIVLSRKDWEGSNATIIAHEKAHITYGHSVELLLVDILSACQWFNPAIWMLRSDLQELHEYEADDAVLRSGANLRDYQYLLIRKAVGKSGYSVANSLNHSILKNRITMMSKSKSPLRRGLRVLYLLPLVCLGIGLQAKTVYVPTDKDSENYQNPLIILREAWGQEKEITKAEYDALDQGRINSVQMLTDDAAFKKYGDKAAHGVIVVNLKAPMEMDEIVVVSYRGEDEPIPFRLVPDQMPSFQGGGLNEFSKWLCRRIDVPKDCAHSGTMRISFEVQADGTVGDIEVTESVCPELDALVTNLIRQSPKWEPGTAGGKPVATNLKLPIIFQVRHNAKK